VLEAHRPSLEDVYLELTDDGERAPAARTEEVPA
jgi:hypothetical protein